LIRLVAEGGSRLDVFLARRRPERSRRRWEREVREGRVRVNGRWARPSLSLRAGDVVEAQEEAEASAEAPAVGLKVLYRDEDLLVIDKPAGLQVQPSKYDARSVVAGLAAYGPLPSLGGPERAGIVHRLDRDVSGVMVVALSERALRSLYRQFKERRVKKVYRAIVHGKLPRDTVRIDAPLAMRKRQWKGKVSRKGKAAVTLVRRLKVEGDRTHVEAEPVTGRPHQIRIHLASIGHPIVGDTTYGSSERIGRVLLHARSLAFTHPSTGRQVRFESNNLCPTPDIRQ
jgi:23S rRNA pseudouridine1911/1915/1917 synthase